MTKRRPAVTITAAAVGLMLMLLAPGAYAAPATGTPRWSLQAASQLPYSALSGVACLSPTWCKAVGGFATSEQGPYRNVIESWNGRVWTVDPSPASEVGIFSVSCVSRTFCMAVGSTSSPGTPTLIESWDGTRWSVDPSPVPPGGGAQLFGVSCASVSACMAVGSYVAPARTLAESWDGTRWALVPTPNIGPSRNLLFGVSCPSVTSCTAVGYFVYSKSEYEASLSLVESWDGTRWSIVPSPSPAGTFTGLQAVSCVSPTWCMAVGGGAHTAGDRSWTFIQQWNGTRWATVPSPNKGLQSGLDGVSCVSTMSCQAVGYGTKGTNTTVTLAEVWNGNRWAVLSTPDYPSNQSILDGVSCTGPASCTAVGSFHVHGIFYRALIETYG